MSYLSRALPSLLSLGAALVAVLILIILGSSDPAAAINAFFLGPFSRLYHFGNMLDNASYILIAGIGVLAAFKGGAFNLGGEGQVYAAAFASALFLASLPTALGALGIILGLLLAIVTGAVLASFSALLKRYLNVNELISSYLLSLGLIPVFDSLISGPLRDRSSNLLTTPAIDHSFWLPGILPPSSLNISFFLAIALSLGAAILLKRSRLGFELRLSGSNPKAAEASGIPARVYAFGAFVLSGAIHGLAGGLAVTGTYHAALVGVTSGLGWNGIAAALIGRINPMGTLWGAIFFAYLQAGAKTAMIHTRFSSELAVLVQAFVFLFVTAELARKRKMEMPHA